MSSAHYNQQQNDAYLRAQEAKARLLRLVDDFAFQGLVDQAAWLAGLLTVIARAVCMPAPMFVVSASCRGSSASLLCEIVARIALGCPAPRVRQAADSAAQRSQVIATGRNREAMVVIDNPTLPLGNAKLDEALVSREWRVRLLGQEHLTTLSLATVWWASGQHIRFDTRHDTVRRALVIKVGASTTDLESCHRTITGYADKNRAALLADVQAVLAGWALCKTAQSEARFGEWGVFANWSDNIRGAVVWLGLPDPAASRVSERESRQSVRGERVAGHV